LVEGVADQESEAMVQAVPSATTEAVVDMARRKAQEPNLVIPCKTG
jgi:hypothetical protein